MTSSSSYRGSVYRLKISHKVQLYSWLKRRQRMKQSAVHLNLQMTNTEANSFRQNQLYKYELLEERKEENEL